MDETIEIRHLNVKFHTEHGDVPAVKDVSLILRYGIITGLIGETGSGKSVLASAILRMLPDYAEASGSIWYRGNELLEATAKMMRRIRRTQIGLIPQSPGESLNPSRRVIAQAAECFEGRKNRNRSASSAQSRLSKSRRGREGLSVSAKRRNETACNQSVWDAQRFTVDHCRRTDKGSGSRCLQAGI